MKSIQNKGINLTAEDLKNRIADRKERYAKQQVRREKLEQTMENTRNDIEQLELHRWNVPPSAPAMLPYSLPVLSPASVSLASLPVFPVFSTTFSTACTVA